MRTAEAEAIKIAFQGDKALVSAARARQPRHVEAGGERRRRRDGSLDMGVQMRLEVGDPDLLDLKHYVYRWANDENGRLEALTRRDDYDFCTKGEIGEAFDGQDSKEECDGAVRRVVGQNKAGEPIYAYLVKKPREFWSEDYEGMIKRREAMMQARVVEGAGAIDDMGAAGRTAYVPQGVRAGRTGARQAVYQGED